MNDFIKTYKKEILIGVVAVVIIIIVKRNFYKFDGFMKPQQREDSPVQLTASRKIQIEQIGKDIYNDIYSTGWLGHDYSPYNKALALYDNEIEYLADYYRNHIASGNKLHDDINSQWYATGDEPARLVNRLSELKRN